MNWYTNSKTSDLQGLICDEDTGKNIAVSYNVEDAQLIAAAPELLKALQYLLVETNQHAEGNCPKLLEACQQAQAAIRKATGDN